MVGLYLSKEPYEYLSNPLRVHYNSPSNATFCVVSYNIHVHMKKERKYHS